MRLKSLLKKYLQGLGEVADRGDAREESFYPALSGLLAEAAKATARTDV
jgi:hypothetical protein